MRKLRMPGIWALTREGRPEIGRPAEQAIINDLRSEADLDVYTLDQLTHTNDSYPEAIPILLRHLEYPHEREIWNSIIRSLTTKEARGIAFEPIYKLYVVEKDTKLYGVKAAMANALSYLAEKKDIPNIINLVLDEKHGPTRIYFIDTLASHAGASNLAEIKKTLEHLTNDSDEYIPVRAKKALLRKKFQTSEK